MDYLPVKVNVLPNKQNGEQFTADEFLQYIRLNINNLVDPYWAQFNPVDCTAMQSENTNLPCYMSSYELCRTNGNSVAVCDCQEAGGNLDDCIETKKCDKLKNLIKSDSINTSIMPEVNTLRTKLSAGNNEWSVSYEKKWADGNMKGFPQDDGIQEGPSGTRSVVETGTRWFGSIHTHPEGG